MGCNHYDDYFPRLLCYYLFDVKHQDMENYFMKEPCKHCPYRHDVVPFLHPERGIELAYHAQNPYNSFPCHKTTESDDNEGYSYRTAKSLECAGFLSLQINEGGSCPDGFTPSDKAYGCADDMIYAYEELNDK
jgi:hypothetical protein